ncbi:hypothetical protein [Saccharopolyspora gloriosae]|uniref:hypothetical protein n=1 Tax=Saccharopolyspora gloriosae TaxID=455344 RepID=UPI001FB78457|nr:hypothetical protein [Saccharopolyspora gloriosae]
MRERKQGEKGPGAPDIVVTHGRPTHPANATSGESSATSSVLGLHGTIGNAAVSRLITAQRRPDGEPVLQRVTPGSQSGDQRPASTHGPLRGILRDLDRLMNSYQNLITKHREAVRMRDLQNGTRPDINRDRVLEIMDVLQDIERLRRSDAETEHWCTTNASWLRQVRDSLDVDLRISTEEWQNFGYFVMLNFGRLWGLPEMGGLSFNGSYLDYFKSMSARTRASLDRDEAVTQAPRRPEAPAGAGKKDSGDTPDKWTDSLRQKVEAALNKCVLRHYAPASRVKSILGPDPDSALKSLAVLNNEGAAATHNTGAFDLEDLANHGFVFFYIEPVSAGFRGSRFGEGEPARITLPIRALQERNGWIMLNDFLDQESPTLRADKGGELLSYTRAENPSSPSDPYRSVPAKSPAGKLKKSVEGMAGLYARAEVRVQEVAALADQIRALAETDHEPANSDTTADLHRMFDLMRDLQRAESELSAEISTIDPTKLHELSETRRESLDDAERFSRKVRIYRKPANLTDSTMQYYGPQGRDERQEPLPSNVLVGADVVPGLAQRCVVEVARIHRQHPDVAQRLMSMPGEELIRVLLKDFTRPQAMLQKKVPFTRGNVEFKAP